MDYTEDSLPGKEVSHNEGSSSEEQQKFLEALEELKIWKRKVEEAETNKSRLLIEKLDSEESKKQAQKEVQALTKEDTSLEMKEAQENNILDLEKRNRALLDYLKKRETILKNKKAECATLEQKLKINAEIPEKKVVFTRVEKETGKENYDSIVSVFSVTQRPLFLLKGCQALITFEKEEVAEQILRQANCPVIFDTKKINVKPNHVTLEPSVEFEIHMEISKRKIRFSNTPSGLPEEQMRDWLEARFSKPSRGGGEVVDVSYDKNAGSGQITFLNTGVAEDLTLEKNYCLDANRKIVANIFPSFEYQLKQFQNFYLVSKRTVLLGGIEDIQDVEDQQDSLEIHFQRPTNHGGEVESVKYLSEGKTAQVFFTEDATSREIDD
ncbi:hypothetical protein SKAU_G00230740 [Synaphobranchus kaupii]|uniref:NID domain-containing protein n=1 Tax=Synaphobranchus kaupii TaxID=118154 RepID=A0A9Q1F5R2_SYNKA|nr:hypothetical protein SKAU_G00230740 [Synaphobranchus kaupii]